MKELTGIAKRLYYFSFQTFPCCHIVTLGFLKFRMNSVSRLLDPESFQFQFLLTLLALYLFTTCNACGIGNFISFLGTLTISTFLAWKITKLIQKRFFEKKLGAEQKAVLVTGMNFKMN